MSGELLAVDTPWLLYRSHFALPSSIRGAGGARVGALLGTVNTILGLVQWGAPRAVVCCLGAEEADYRVALYPPYHAHRDPMPDELRQARWLLREREEFMAERNREADALMDDVRAQAEHMVQRTEIVRQANSVAQRILDDANDEARTMRHEAEDFCDQKLAGMEIVLDRLTRTVQSGRAKLAAAPPPPPLETAGAHAGSTTEEDGFFDQDVS